MDAQIKLWKKYRYKKKYDIQNYFIKSATSLKNQFQKLFSLYPEIKNKYFFTNFKNLDFDNLNLNLFENSLKDIQKILNRIENKKEAETNSCFFIFSLIDNVSFVDKDFKSIFREMQDKNSILKKDEKNNFKFDTLRIAIDGPSGSGKSTIAKFIANKLNLIYINTGLVYRSIAFFLMRENINLKNEKQILNSLAFLKIILLPDEFVQINNLKLKNELRTNEISEGASIVSSIKSVREFALKIQKEFANEKRIIMDGRDTTFKIMPHANLKIFLNSSIEIRAKRRSEQNKKLKQNNDYFFILEKIKKRDLNDFERKIDPLQKKADVIEIDSSYLTVEELFEKIMDLIKK